MTRRTRGSVLALAAALLAVPVLLGAPAQAETTAPTLTLTTDRPVYVAGQTVSFRSQVVAQNLDWYLQVQYPGSSEWRNLCLAVNANTDTFTCQLGVYVNVSARALLIDDHGTKSTADDTVEAVVNRKILVRAAIGTTYYGYYVKSGQYAVFGRNAKPTFATSSQPAFPGKRCLRHQVQRKYPAGWRTVKTSSCQLERTQGRVDWRWTGNHPSNVKFRVRATFAGDAANLPANAAWVYFKFR